MATFELGTTTVEIPETDLRDTCWDCRVPIGAAHMPSCDVAVCLQTGRDRIDCDLDHDCGHVRHTGLWPAELEATVYGLWLSDAAPDVDGVREQGEWDPQRQVWLHPSAPDPDLRPVALHG